jgi:hypothetical protein
MPTDSKGDEREIGSRRKAEPTRATCDKFGSIAGNSQRASTEKFSLVGERKSDFASALRNGRRRCGGAGKISNLQMDKIEIICHTQIKVDPSKRQTGVMPHIIVRMAQPRRPKTCGLYFLALLNHIYRVAQYVICDGNQWP